MSLYGTKEKTDAKIEVFLLRELNEEMRLWDVLVEPARKIRIGNKLFFDDVNEMVAEVIDNTTSRGRTLRFLYDEDGQHDVFKRSLFALGEAPLPRYIIDNREVHHATEEDMEDFQCVFAEKEGAVTAPATGLHFSRELMKRMEIRGINSAFITLHCGLGNFHEIEVEDLTKHKMDSEQMHIGKEACELVNDTKRAGHHVCAIGTKPDGSPWRIAVQNPADENDYVGVVEISDACAVTSGGYQRYFEENGKKYHHIIDPATGKPAESGLTSVTIICKDGTKADALSTALYVMGLDDALAYWKTQDDFEVIFVTEDGEVVATEGLKDSFTFDGKGNDYTYRVAKR